VLLPTEFVPTPPTETPTPPIETPVPEPSSTAQP
jgi:hypothetical protein